MHRFAVTVRANRRVWLSAEATDMRCGFDRLADRSSRSFPKTSSVRNFGANMLGDEQQRCVEGSCGLGVLLAEGLTCRRRSFVARRDWHFQSFVAG
jgi:hypothetical protein